MKDSLTLLSNGGWKGAVVMKTTGNFNKIDKKVQKVILDNADYNGFGLATVLGVKFLDATERSIVYEFAQRYILKEYKEKGKRDSDIKALLDLDGISYFPELYVYKEFDYLIMEKAKGECLHNLLRDGSITEIELQKILEQLIDATTLALENNRYDYDFKLEHLFWDGETIMLVDLGICDKITVFYPSFDDMIDQRIQDFIVKVSRLGYNINK